MVTAFAPTAGPTLFATSLAPTTTTSFNPSVVSANLFPAFVIKSDSEILDNNSGAL